MFRHTITANEMENSPNLFIKDNGVIYGADEAGSDIEQLFVDYRRGVTVFGQDAGENRGFNSLADFIKFVKIEVSPRQFKQLEKYSQGCLLFIGSPSFIPIQLSMTDLYIREPAKEDRSLNIENKFELNEDGEVVSVIYQRVKVRRYPICDKSFHLLGYIEGHTSALFKLTDKGFELQRLETDSALIRDLYLKEMTQDELYARLLQAIGEKTPAIQHNFKLFIEMAAYLANNVLSVLQNEIAALDRENVAHKSTKIDAIASCINAISQSISHGRCKIIAARMNTYRSLAILATLKNEVRTHLQTLAGHTAFTLSARERIMQCFLDYMAYFGYFKNKKNEFYTAIRRNDYSRQLFFRCQQPLLAQPSSVVSEPPLLERVPVLV